MAQFVQDLPATKSKKRYAQIIELLQSKPGEWLQLDPSEVAGVTKVRRQTAIRQAALQRGINIETQTVGETLYVRSVPSEVVSA